MNTTGNKLSEDRLHHLTSRSRAADIAAILKGAKIQFQMKAVIGDPDGCDTVISVLCSDQAACFAFRVAIELP